MAGKAKRPGYDELAGQVATLREQERVSAARDHTEVPLLDAAA